MLTAETAELKGKVERLEQEAGKLKQQSAECKEEAEKLKQDADRHRQEVQRQRQVLLEKEMELEDVRRAMGPLESEIARLMSKVEALEGQLHSHGSGEQEGFKRIEGNRQVSGEQEGCAVEPQPPQLQEPQPHPEVAQSSGAAKEILQGTREARDGAATPEGVGAGSAARGRPQQGAEAGSAMALGKRPRSDGEKLAGEAVASEGLAKRLHSGAEPSGAVLGLPQASEGGASAAGAAEGMHVAAGGGAAVEGGEDVGVADAPGQLSAADELLEEMEEDIPQGTRLSK